MFKATGFYGSKTVVFFLDVLRNLLSLKRNTHKRSSLNWGWTQWAAVTTYLLLISAAPHFQLVERENLPLNPRTAIQGNSPKLADSPLNILNLSLLKPHWFLPGRSFSLFVGNLLKKLVLSNGLGVFLLIGNLRRGLGVVVVVNLLILKGCPKLGVSKEEPDGNRTKKEKNNLYQ